MMASGGLIVMDEDDDCMVDIAKFFLNLSGGILRQVCCLPYRHQTYA